MGITAQVRGQRVGGAEVGGRSGHHGTGEGGLRRGVCGFHCSYHFDCITSHDDPHNPTFTPLRSWRPWRT